MAKAKSTKEKHTVHVVSGTHWDREWRFTAEQSKLRMADLIDNVINILETRPDYAHFVIDGGLVVLEDYLSVRPQNRERIKKLITADRIGIVNWYTLPGINLVAPEALIRNYLIGQRIANEFGGPMKAGYTATGYGQPSQMPQIYRGFGMESAMFYRGTNKHQTPPVSNWKGRDGSTVTLVRGFDRVTRTNWFFLAFLPIARGKSGNPLDETDYAYNPKDLTVHMADEELYEMGFKSLTSNISFPKDKKSLLSGFQHFRDHSYRQAIGKQVLALDMEDNASPWPDLPDMIAALNEVLDDTTIVQTTLDDYMTSVMRETKSLKLKTLKGELRQEAVEYGWNGLYGMTSSARVRMKLENERAETGLMMIAEPLATLAERLGDDYPRINLDEAWLTLLKNHSHDSICGASVDDVHKDMSYRFRQVRTVSEEVGKRAIESIWKRIDHSSFNQDDQTLTVFNSLPTKRQGIRMFVLDLPEDLFAPENYQRTPTGFPDPYLFDILDDQGKAVDYSIIDAQDITIGYEGEGESSGASLRVKRHRVLLDVDLPPLGYRSFAIRKHPPRYVLNPKPGKERGHIAQPGGILENRYLKVQINPNGTFDLTDKVNKQTYNNLHHFEDRIAAGSWPHMDHPAYRDQSVTTLGVQSRITVMESNQHRGCYRIELNLAVPARAIDPWYRSSDTVDMPISVDLTLSKNSKRLDIRTRVDNTARDHRLLVMMPTNIKTDQVDVESAFSIEQRNILFKEIGDNTEAHHVYQPMQNFIDMSDSKRGLAFLNRGMREYAAWDDPARTVSLTLFRAYRVYMTANTNLTPEEYDKHSGTSTLGKMEFNYAIYPHSGNWLAGKVLPQAYDFKVPARALQGPVKKGKLPATTSLVTIKPQARVMLSAFCQSDDGKDSIMRICNMTDSKIDAKISTRLPIKTVHKVKMDEKGKGRKLPLNKGAFTVPLRPAEIATIRMR